MKKIGKSAVETMEGHLMGRSNAECVQKRKILGLVGYCKRRMVKGLQNHSKKFGTPLPPKLDQGIEFCHVGLVKIQAISGSFGSWDDG